MIKQQEINERRDADRAYAEAHRARRGELVRVNSSTLIAIPAGRNKEEYMVQWQQAYKRYTNRFL